jgi:hypothetical protein
LAALPAAAQLPDLYKSVDRVVWVVDDADKVTAAWREAGFAQVQHRSETEWSDEFRGRPVGVNVRILDGYFGDVHMEWIQPLQGDNAYAEFLKKHGSGIFSLVHRASTLVAFNQELSRLKALGVATLERGELKVDTEADPMQYAFMDTAAEGKYVLGLIYVPSELDDPAGAPAAEKKIMQFAFAVHDLKPVSAYWEKLGLGPLAFNKSNLSDVRYHGKLVDPVDLEFGWQRGRKVVYEWLHPVSLPSVLEDHIKEHGEGIHHLATQVDDLDVAVASWVSLGYKPGQTGAWGEAGKKGSGRYAYIDTESIGGVTMELLWNYR